MDEATQQMTAFLEAEMAKLAETYLRKNIEPWAREKTEHALAAKVLSAGPTRGGGSFQVRIRLSPKKLVCATGSRWATHDLDPVLKTRTIKSRPKLMDLFLDLALRNILCIQELENSLRVNSANVLCNAVAAAFPQTAGRQFGRQGGRDIAFEMSRKYVSDLELGKRVLGDARVLKAVDALADKMISAVLAIPDHAYGKNAEKAEMSDAKKRLLAAMKRAMHAGLSDEDIESVKMIALASHVMES